MQGGWLLKPHRAASAQLLVQVPERPGALPQIRATLAEILGRCSLRPTRARGLTSTIPKVRRHELTQKSNFGDASVTVLCTSKLLQITVNATARILEHTDSRAVTVMALRRAR